MPVLLGGLAGWIVPISEWAASAKSLLTILAIFAAAILVRLNRGMPTIDWAKIDAEQRLALTRRIVRLSHEYGVALVAIGATLALFVMLDRAAPGTPFSTTLGHLSTLGQCAVSGFAGASLAFACARIAYVVWRDIDVVELQTQVINDAAKLEIAERKSSVADAIVEATRINKP